MRVLIDESLPLDLAGDVVGFEVSTARVEGWMGLRNGALLRAAVDRGFEVLITADRALRDQQNLEEIGIAVLILTGVRNRIEPLRMLVPQILSILPLLRPGDSFEIAPLRGDIICDRPIQRPAVSITGAAR